ncbi:hypothetical protein GCM10007897_44250 [Sphingobium jiangsuense]|uniref:Uncharacterized protein n=1 Tax=Sphingobium jiangsuense TaxID=870476 RepID=A0A7W6BPX2_9SPHN|nr:hypothetical protein [Sphingobium jiangsuense]MBB3928956.1 hypothetical protein [Sphingobium jiangsuense]GLT02988.1 hypothetical protein GCM10007897_44250 [Sphingobium jiangsuense]
MGVLFTAGRVCRTIWNGPFYIGKVTRPASVGDVLMKLLETAWRLVVSAALLAGVVSIWFGYLNDKLFPPLKDQIEISASWDDGTMVSLPPKIGVKADTPLKCEGNWPVRVQFFNRSSKTVSLVAFSIQAHQPNRSMDVSEYTPTRESDVIIPPRMGYSQCWSVPIKPGYDPSKLIYEANVDWVYENTSN